MERLTTAEEELMNVFWNVEKPLTSVDILTYAKEKTWNGNYVHKMLRGLERKVYLEVCGNVLYANRYARQFQPLISKEDYAASLLAHQGINTKSFAKVALAFVKTDRMKDTDISSENESNEDLIKELEEMIQCMKNEKDK